MKYIFQSHAMATAFALVLSFVSITAQAVEGTAQQAISEKQKVVFQVSAGDPKIWNLALNNAKNVQQELGAQNADIEIVVYGPGIGMLKFDSVVANRIDEAVKDGVKIVACENTMKLLNLTKDDMLSSLSYVSAGVIELMKKQKEGYAYIRP